MVACHLSSLFHFNRKKGRSLVHPTPIQARARTVDDVEIWRSAILTYDAASHSNLISRHLVTNILGEPIRPIDNEANTQPKIRPHGEEIDGFVYLDWRWENNSQQLYNTRFFVTTTSDPPYDAVLGKEDAIQYGMLKA